MRKGTCIGRTYQVVEDLGEGGAGQVVLVLHRRTLKLYALKEIPLGGKKWTGVEREVLRHLNHPGLPEIYDLFEEGGCAYLVMEYISGKNLWELKKEQGPFKEGKILHCMEELLDILQYLHYQIPPLIHGDIKPSNLMLDENGRLVLLDFGASFTGGCEKGKTYGTLAYASPEQISGYPAMDQRSDLYSLGKTFRTLLGGRESRELQRILDKCEEPNRIYRYASAKEVRRAVEALRKKKRKKIRVFLLLMAGCLLFGSCLAVRWKRAHENRQYQFLLQSHQISKVISAIRSFPYREEAYQKLLQLFLEDGSFTEEESTQMEQLLLEYETVFQQNQAGYPSFCYELGLAYWYSYVEQGGKQYGGDWFGKAALGKLSEEKACWARIYEKLGAYYLGRARKERTGEDTENWKQFLSVLDEVSDLPGVKKEGEARLLRIQEELLVQFYDLLPQFLEEGVSKERLWRALDDIKAVSFGNTSEKFEIVEECLEGLCGKQRAAEGKETE